MLDTSVPPPIKERRMDKKDEVVERMARIGYQSMHEGRWDDLPYFSIERTAWLKIASDMLAELRWAWEQAKNE